MTCATDTSEQILLTDQSRAEELRAFVVSLPKTVAKKTMIDIQGMETFTQDESFPCNCVSGICSAMSNLTLEVFFFSADTQAESQPLPQSWILLDSKSENCKLALLSRLYAGGVV